MNAVSTFPLWVSFSTFLTAKNGAATITASTSVSLLYLFSVFFFSGTRRPTAARAPKSEAYFLLNSVQSFQSRHDDRWLQKDSNDVTLETVQINYSKLLPFRQKGVPLVLTPSWNRRPKQSEQILFLNVKFVEIVLCPFSLRWPSSSDQVRRRKESRSSNLDSNETVH